MNDENDQGVLGALGDAVKNSSAAQRLGDEAKNYLQAKGGDLASSLTDKLEDAAGSGGLLSTAGMEGAKKLAQGESPAKAALGGALGGVKEKVKSAFGGGGKSKGGSSKAMYIIEDLDIGVPVSTAYNQWTQFQEFSSFMKGVQSVDPSDEIESTWRMKVFKSNRSNTAKISEQLPDRRIAWSSDGAKGSCKGVVTFHPLGDDLTKILLVLEYYPSGFFEKTANIWRAVGRRARLDLKRFRDYVTIQGEESGSWRGEIRDGEVVKQPDEVEAEEREAEEGEESEAEQADEGEGEYAEEGEYDTAEEGEEGEEEPDEEYEDEYADEEYEEPDEDWDYEDYGDEEPEYEEEDYEEPDEEPEEEQSRNTGRRSRAPSRTASAPA